MEKFCRSYAQLYAVFDIKPTYNH